MLNLQKIRMDNEERELEENADTISKHCKFKKINPNQYVLQYIGQEGTNQEGAYIVVDLDITNFPNQPPVAVFRNQYRHLNVNPENGRLSLNLINQKTFCLFTNLFEIFIGIGSIIHKPTFKKHWDKSLLITGKDGLGYDEKMIIQTEKFKNEKYKVL